jgi:hypothetical protein
MSRHIKFLGTASVLALAVLASNPALADFSGTLQGDYAHVDVSNGGGSGDEWGGAGSGRFSLGSWGLNAQVDGGYHQLSANGGGGTVDDWNVDGSLFWLGSMGRVGASVGYNGLNVSGGGGNGHVTNYGGFAEWFAAPMVTIGAKGGAASTSGNGGTADYFGGEAVWYVIPDVDLNGTIDYVSLTGEHLTNYAANVEWLVSESTPVSIYGGYGRTEISGGGAANTWLVGLKFYTNSNGSSTLVDRQRTGNVDWANHVNVLGVVL